MLFRSYPSHANTNTHTHTLSPVREQLIADWSAVSQLSLLVCVCVCEVNSCQEASVFREVSRRYGDVRKVSACHAGLYYGMLR